MSERDVAALKQALTNNQRPGFPTQDDIRQRAAEIAEHHPFEADHPAVIKAVSQRERLPFEVVEAALDETVNARRRAADDWWAGMLTLDRLMALDVDTSARWLIEDAVRGGALNAVVGINKAGKSRLTLAVIEALLTGSPFLGEFAVPAPVPVWLFANDDSTAELQLLTQEFVRARGVSVAGERFRVAINTAADLTSRRFLRDLSTRVEAAAEPPVLVFDSLYNFAEIDDTDRPAAKRLMNDLKRFCDETGATVIVIDHSAKEAGGGSHSMIGSQVKGARVRSGINVEKLDTALRDDGRHITTVRLHRWGNAGREWERTYEHDGKGFSWTQTDDARDGEERDLCDRTAVILGHEGGSAALKSLCVSLSLPGSRPERKLREALATQSDRFRLRQAADRQPWTVELIAGWQPEVAI